MSRLRRLTPIAATLAACAVLCALAWADSVRPIPNARPPVGVAAVHYGSSATAIRKWVNAGGQIALLNDSNLVDTLHAYTNNVIGLRYTDAFNLQTSYNYYAEASKQESSFVHCNDPAYTVHIKGTTTDSIYWFPDRRGSVVPLRGYAIYRRNASLDSPFVLVDTVAASANPKYISTGLATTTNYEWYINMIDSAGVRRMRPYSYTSSMTTGSLSATMFPYRLTVDTTGWNPAGNAYVSVTIGVRISNLTGVGTATATCYWDSTQNNVIDTTNVAEKKPMVHTAGTDSFVTTIKVDQAYSSNGMRGCMFWIKVPYTASGNRTFGSSTVYHSTSVNNRIKAPAFRSYLMVPGDSTWRRVHYNNATFWVWSGFDGMFVDDAANGYGTGNGDCLPFTADTTSWNAGVDSLLVSITNGACGGMVVPNGGGYTGHTSTSDGTFLEGWVVASTANSFTQWRADLNNAITALQTSPYTDRLFLHAYCDSDSVALRQFAFGSALLVTDARRVFYGSDPLSFQMTYYPEQDVILGAPKKTFTSNIVAARRSGGLYRRDFQRGMVLVNPSDSTYTEYLRKTYYKIVPTGGQAPRLGGLGAVTTTRVRAITLGPRRAAILVSNLPWTTRRGTRL